MQTNLSAQQRAKSLRFSFLDGIFASTTVGFTQEYFTPFLLLLGATSRHIAMLNALPNLFASLIQFKIPDFVESVKSRRKVINSFVFLQAVMLVPMAVVAYHGGVCPVIFIVMVIAFTFFGAIAAPAWGSLMSDLVSEAQRGEYFGWRNKVLGFVMIITAFMTGFILHNMKKVNIFYGFALIFGLAFIARLISWCFLKKMHEPPIEYGKENSFTLLDFLSRIKESNFAQFVLFVSMMNFSVNLASPFFAVFMLRDLNFSYMLYTVITLIATTTIYLLIGRWGRHADKIGNIKIIRFVSPIIGIIPLLWVLNHQPVFLIFAQMVSGFAWAGFNLCASNFIYDAVSPAKRTRCIAYFNVLNGLALSIGALLGGLLLTVLPSIFGYKILMLFVISSFLRILVAIFMPLRLKEVRSVRLITNNQLFFSMIGIKPLLGVERKTIRY